MEIGFVLFPQLIQLDFTRPLQVLHRHKVYDENYARMRESLQAAIRS